MDNNKQNDSIDRMIEKYESIDELRAYANGQYKTILKLTKRLANLEDELENLKVRGLPEDQAPMTIPDLGSISDEEAICLMELNRLRNRSMLEELTAEECKKVETYVRTLLSIKEKKAKEPPKTRSIDTADLLAAMDNVLKLP